MTITRKCPMMGILLAIRKIPMDRPASRGSLRAGRLVIVISMAAGCSIPVSISACTVPRDYHVPSTIEMVEQADVIVLAKVEGDRVDAETGLTMAQLRPFALIKGSELPVTVPLEDAVLATSQFEATVSDPRNLVEPNPDVFAGGCNRHVFDEGSTLVAFLSRQHEQYRVRAKPFSRALEDVPSPDSLWVKAVRMYARIAAFPPAQRRQEMLSEKTRLSDDGPDPDRRLLALELDRALRDDRLAGW